MMFGECGRQLTKFYTKNGINTAYQLKNMHNAIGSKKIQMFLDRVQQWN